VYKFDLNIISNLNMMMMFIIYWKIKNTGYKGRGKKAYQNINNSLVDEVNRLNEKYPEIHHYLMLYKNI